MRSGSTPASTIRLDDDCRRRNGERQRLGKAAVSVLVRKGTPERVLLEISKYGAERFETSLNDDGERRPHDTLDSGEAPAGEAR